MGQRKFYSGVVGNGEVGFWKGWHRIAVEKRETGRTATAEQAHQKAVADLNAEREQFNKDRDASKKAQDDLKKTIEQLPNVIEARRWKAG